MLPVAFDNQGGLAWAELAGGRAAAAPPVASVQELSRLSQSLSSSLLLFLKQEEKNLMVESAWISVIG